MTAAHRKGATPIHAVRANDSRYCRYDTLMRYSLVLTRVVLYTSPLLMFGL